MNKQDKNHLDHAVERLLASRDKAKKQYFIERITYLWNPKERFTLRALPAGVFTEESVKAVISFADDDSEDVRRAVAQALGTSDQIANIGRETLEKLLSDKSSLVRFHAATSSSQRGQFNKMPQTFIESLLEDSVWSVRWLASMSLANSDLNKKAWATVISSVPSHPLHLIIWSKAALKLAKLREEKLQVKGILEKCIASEEDDCLTGWAKADLDEINQSLQM